jgi:hypothetical protein
MNVDVPYKDVNDIYELLSTLHNYHQAVDIEQSIRSLSENKWSPLTLEVEQSLNRVENILKDYHWRQRQEQEREEEESVDDDTEDSGSE